MCHLLSRSHKLFWIASRVSRVIFFFTSIIFGCWLRRLSTVPPPRHAYTHPATISSPSTPPAPIHICHTLLSTPHHHLLRLFSLPATAPPFPILHSCQAATCSLQHAAQLLCYNDKLRSTVAGRSHYLLLLPWKT